MNGERWVEGVATAVAAAVVVIFGGMIAAFGIALALLPYALIGGVVYVVWHFLSKIW